MRFKKKIAGIHYEFPEQDSIESHVGNREGISPLWLANHEKTSIILGYI